MANIHLKVCHIGGYEGKILSRAPNYLISNLSCFQGFCQVRLVLPFSGRSNMKITIAQVLLVSQQQNPKKTLQIYRCIINTFLCILVIRSYQCITEIPGMISKKIVTHIKAKWNVNIKS